MNMTKGEYGSWIPKNRANYRAIARGRHAEIREQFYASNTDFKLGYFEEIARRLNQLEILCKRIDQLDRRKAKKLKVFNIQFPSVIQLPSNFLKSIQDEQITYVEAYYLIAWRTIKAICAAGLGKIDGEADGVVMVRNKLIEHPEQVDVVVEWSYSEVGTCADIKLKSQANHKLDALNRFFSDNDLQFHVAANNAFVNFQLTQP
jgi:hypothetical protein